MALEVQQTQYYHYMHDSLTTEEKDELLYQSLKDSLATQPFTDEELREYRRNPIKFIEYELHFYSLTPKQKKFLRSFVRFRRPYSIVKASRGSGKTFLLSMLVLWFTVCFPNFQVCIVSGSFEQSLILYDYCVGWINDNIRIRNFVAGDPLRIVTKFINGSWFKCLTASEKQVRGPHPNVLIVDEAVLVKPTLYKSAIGMLGDRKPMCLIVSSTPQNDVGIILFRDLWENEDFKRNQFHWTAYDCPWKDQAEIERKRRQMSKDEFATDMLGEFSSITGSVYDLEDILNSRTTRMFERDNRFFCYLGVDWGKGAHTFVVIIQKNRATRKYEVLWAENYSGRKFTWILKRIALLCEYFEINEVLADSSHEGENERLEDVYKLNVNRVAFGKMVVPKTKTKVQKKKSIKEVMIRNSKEKFELDFMRIPSRDYAIAQGLPKEVYRKIPPGFDTLITQCRNYHRDENGKIVKEDDHGVDAMQLSLFGHLGGQAPTNMDMEIAEMEAM